MTDKKDSTVPQQQQKLSFKDIWNFTGQLLQDLKQLQQEKQTLFDIVYHYRIQDGRLVRKRARRGSFAGDSGEEKEDSSPTLQEALKNPR